MCNGTFEKFQDGPRSNTVTVEKLSEPLCGFAKHARSTGERVAIIQTFLKTAIFIATHLKKYYWLMFIFFIVDYVCMWRGGCTLMVLWDGI